MHKCIKEELIRDVYLSRTVNQTYTELIQLNKNS